MHAPAALLALFFSLASSALAAPQATTTTAPASSSVTYLAPVPTDNTRAVHTVVVGGGTTRTFNPAVVMAAENDTIAFVFESGNHTVTQSSFTSPCSPLAGGVDSKFVPISATPMTFRILVKNASQPLWFYCAQQGHCAAGMVMAVNPTADKTFDAFKATALGVSAPPAAASPTSAAARRATNPLALSPLALVTTMTMTAAALAGGAVALL